jgi:hypothetical protein
LIRAAFAAGSIRSFAAETTDPGNPILRKQLALARAALFKAQELLRIKDLDLQRSWYVRRPLFGGRLAPIGAVALLQARGFWVEERAPCDTIHACALAIVGRGTFRPGRSVCYPSVGGWVEVRGQPGYWRPKRTRAGEYFKQRE